MCLTDALCPTYHVVFTLSVVSSPGLENQFNHVLERGVSKLQCSHFTERNTKAKDDWE